MFKSFFSRLIALFLIFSAPWSFASVNNLEKFSKHDKYRAVKISPDGKYLAISRYFDGESQLLIVDSKTLNPISHNTFKGREEVGEFFWVNEERIVIKVNARHKFHAAPVYYGELYSLNILSNKGEMIFGNRLTFTRGQGPRRKKILKRHEAMGSSWASIIDILPNDKNHILIRAEPYSTNKNKIARLYKLNVNDASIKFVVEEPVPKSWFFSDDEGNLLLAIGTDKSANKVVFEFDKRTSEWTKVKNFQYGNSFAPLIYDEKKRTLILLDDQSHDTRSLYRLDLKTADRELLFHDTRNDISWVELTEDKQSIYSIKTEPLYPKYDFLNDNSEQQLVFKNLLKQFDGYNISITSNTKDLSKFVFSVSSDRDPGAWYLFDTKLNKAILLAKRNELIDVGEMLPMQAFEFKARDGVNLIAYITLPKENKGLLAAVVLVHGGPFGVRDSWQYNNQVQMLASNGYVVLQVNYRGSRGFGKKFRTSGYEHWGDDIQLDIIYGVDYLIEQKFIDPKRVCIMGGSFGGYSAVQASLLMPHKFKCAIASSGVYDLELLYKEGDTIERIWGKSFWAKTIGDDKSKLKKFSPVNYIKNLTTPLLIVHGKKDERVPIIHAENLRDQLDKFNKEYEWLVFDYEGHGIYSEENRLEYYQRVINFLDKHNPVH